MAVKFTKADYAAIENGDHNYLNNKGAKFYREERYEEAVEYYRMAAAMGSIISISNLGYCYMYARGVPQNMSMAVAYYKAAAAKDDIDAIYKLGNIYKKGAEEIEPDNELALYYYQRALDIVERGYESRDDYPSLYFNIAKELMPKGALPCDLHRAYEYLEIAEKGYMNEEKEGINYHKAALKSVIELKESTCFDDIHKKLRFQRRRRKIKSKT